MVIYVLAAAVIVKVVTLISARKRDDSELDGESGGGADRYACSGLGDIHPVDPPCGRSSV